ncbi:hypothetical protein MAHJHV55_52520 [Mycobacterium avium subsp. hominissuis]
MALQTDDTVADLVTAAAESGFSRFPIADDLLDQVLDRHHARGPPARTHC